MFQISEQQYQAELKAVQDDLDANPWPEDLYEARTLYDEMGPLVSDDIHVDSFTIDYMDAQIFTPPVSDEERIILFLHGGGYVYGSMKSHAGMVAEIARYAESKALHMNYRLAPETPYPAAVDDACLAYEWLLEKGYQANKISIVGDSAGGGLVMCTLIALKEKGVALPGSTVCISPWVDLEGKGESYQTRQELDPMIDQGIVEFVTTNYLNGADPKLPTVSPIHGDFTGFPPLLVQVGEREVLFSDAQMLVEKAQASGMDVTFEEWKDMVHVWHLFYPMLTAGREAMYKVGRFIIDKTA